MEAAIADGDPHWTTTGSWTMGLDPLGLQSTSIRIYQTLIPSVTNITNRLRYYSFYPWLVQTYERLHHSDDARRWSTFIRRGEALFALATVVAGTESADGLGGANWAFRHRERASTQGIDLKPYTDDPKSSETYLQAVRGNFGNAYAPTLVELGWLTGSSVPVVQGRGAKLADAFSESIGNAGALIEEVLQTGVATADQLAVIGAAIHPAAIPGESSELEGLKNFILGEWEEEKGAKARRATIWLVLDLYSKGVAVGDLDAVRTAFYARTLPDGSTYQPQGGSVDRWRAYQANEYCHIALECLLNAVIGTQRSEHDAGATPRQLVGEVTAQAELPTGLTWSEWADSVATTETGADHVLAQTVLRNLAAGERPDLATIGDAVRLLGLLWARWADSDGGVREIIARAAGPGGRSLDGVIRTIDARHDEPAIDTLAAVLHKHIIVDHQLIAGRKLSAAGTFTYHFLIEDGLLSDGLLGQYGYTNPRLGNLTRVLRDAGLLTIDGVTAAGEAFLEQNQPL